MSIQAKITNWSKGFDSKKSAATALGVTTRYLSMLETGEREVSRTVYKKLMDADPATFTADDFFGGTQ